MNKKELLLEYIKLNVAPILTDFRITNTIKEIKKISASTGVGNLVGHYEGLEYKPPKWVEEILNSKEASIILIDKIDKITKEEQEKFIELLKYRKISTFELPKNCVIMLTADKINKDTINEKIYSLVAII